MTTTHAHVATDGAGSGSHRVLAALSLGLFGSARRRSPEPVAEPLAGPPAEPLAEPVVGMAGVDEPSPLALARHAGPMDESLDDPSGLPVAFGVEPGRHRLAV